MTNYNELSDFEINQRVAKAVGKKVVARVGEFHPHASKYPDAVAIKVNGAVYDYCNNPADAWPIIVENEITVGPNEKGGDTWGAFDREVDRHAKGKNPLRAAMIVFLMMNEKTESK